MEYKSIAKKTIGHLYSGHQSIRESGINVEIIALVELYVSQLNGCAYCCSFHSQELRDLGVSQQLIDKIPGYKHSESFTKQQVLALEWADALTKLCSDLTVLKLQLDQVFSDREIVELTASISLMNALNRIRVAIGEKS